MFRKKARGFSQSPTPPKKTLFHLTHVRDFFFKTRFYKLLFIDELGIFLLFLRPIRLRLRLRPLASEVQRCDDVLRPGQSLGSGAGVGGNDGEGGKAKGGGKEVEVFFFFRLIF